MLRNRGWLWRTSETRFPHLVLTFLMLICCSFQVRSCVGVFLRFILCFHGSLFCCLRHHQHQEIPRLVVVIIIIVIADALSLPTLPGHCGTVFTNSTFMSGNLFFVLPPSVGLVATGSALWPSLSSSSDASREREPGDLATRRPGALMPRSSVDRWTFIYPGRDWRPFRFILTFVVVWQRFHDSATLGLCPFAHSFCHSPCGSLSSKIEGSFEVILSQPPTGRRERVRHRAQHFFAC